MSLNIWREPALDLQGAAEKSIPLRIFSNNSPTTEIFKIKFYTPFVCSQLRKTTKFYSLVGYFFSAAPHTELEKVIKNN